ncbi:MAG: phosphoribosyl-AMP cyclohydrolase [Gammaproteobacteria bacterium]|jgi:phosphoribosyl-AMP cyclohydrolase|nr:phosphoribosyl-AMP cyclohydrolase [Gammaproteobacteria bacterium]
MSWLDEIKWDKQGLVPAIAQDHATGQVLMMAWMNKDSLQLTLQEGRAIYWSRSRGKLWRKGEESGNVQEVKEMRLDCDADVILLSVIQHGGVACHTGRPHCFYKCMRDGVWETDVDVAIDPEEMYS